VAESKFPILAMTSQLWRRARHNDICQGEECLGTLESRNSHDPGSTVVMVDDMSWERAGSWTKKKR